MVAEFEPQKFQYCLFKVPTQLISCVVMLAQCAHMIN